MSLYYVKKTKITLSILLMAVSIPSLAANAQGQEPSSNEFNQYIKDAIEQEIQLAAPAAAKGISTLSNKDFDHSVDSLMEKGVLKQDTIQKIEKLQDAEVVILNIDETGDLVDATSSKQGDIKDQFEKKVTDATYKSDELGECKVSDHKITLQSTLSNRGNTVGKETGAFHRLQTPASNSSIVYNGVMADSITLPTYDIANADDDNEAAYMYTGIDGVAEVGFEGLRSKTTPAGWYPVFHAKVLHTVNEGDDNGYSQPNSRDITYVYRSKRFDNGATINGYKVFYYAGKSDEPTLTIREQINYSNIYVVKFNGLGTTGRSVKRVTAIAMNGVSNSATSFKHGFTSAIWNNMRLLVNNSASAKYPQNVTNLNDDVWDHGGRIDYTNSNSVEKYSFYAR
ncbi:MULTISPECIES: hypothetical protein [Paenibacillus]|uniref:hypothetical protein n=1 Tax=Paenibacillus TaxID=44249 RepID=UPI001D2B7608|nr:MULTISPECIES: hypothetical protein [Paenibacillus]MBZ6444436.1 hypothetical protein [Paenibacillus polymyxa]MBZ6453357.1 hypothetical protein [Paenibacillus polymyxa]